jgi:amino acid transporter/nucleotide-binding universal stress UspA family protein
MARRRNQESHDREVGFGGFLGTAYGYVGTSIYVVLGGVALYALGVTPLVLLLVGVVVVVTSWSYAEASTAMPEASGVTSFARRTLGPLPGFAAAWGLLLDSIILVAIAASFIPHYLGVFWPQLQDRPYSTMCGIGVVALLLLLNVAGLRESVRLSSLVTALGLATLVLLIAVGFLTELKPDVVARQISLGTAPTWASLVFAIPLAAAAFVGLDAVSSRAESARDPARDVPRAIGIVLPLIIVIGIGLAVVALSAMPVTYNVVPVDATTGLTQQVPVVKDDAGGAFVLQSDPSVEVVVPVDQTDAGWVIPAQEPSGDVYEMQGAPATRLYGTAVGSTYLQDPLIGIVDALPADLSWLHDLLRPWLAALISLSLFLAANAVVGGSGRIIYSLAKHAQVPAALGRVDAARRTPYMGVGLFAACAVVLLLPEDPVLLLGLFGFGAALAFTAANVSVIALRYREPSLSRPFVVPFNVRYRGALLPVPALLGAAATALIWVFMIATHPEGRLLGFIWLGAGLVLYVLHRRSARLPLGREAKQRALPTAALVDVDYERILVPVDGTRLADEMMVLGCQLAADKGASIDVVYVVTVPMNLPLEATMRVDRERGRRVLDAALAVAQEFGVQAWPHLVASRTVGRAVVETAEEWNADVIILGAVRRRRLDDRVLDDSTQYVLRHAPGEVLMNYVPEDYPMVGSGAEIDQELAAAAQEAEAPVSGGKE